MSVKRVQKMVVHCDRCPAHRVVPLQHGVVKARHFLANLPNEKERWHKVRAGAHGVREDLCPQCYEARAAQRRSSVVRRIDVRYTTKEIVAANERRIPLLLAAVAEATGIAVPLILGRSRLTETVEARRLFCYILRTRRRMGVSEIGRVIERHHTTVSHHLDRITARPAYEETELLKDILAIVRRMDAEAETTADEGPARLHA